ncbi:TetR/AcrR family transcriptional regulator [Novosphingobium lentum]|uniref:TetR/AcrR family transcriptional regulator n=1 Tax=Novosphingobium lentum TaxID=145287 RepID=UPI0008317CF4|nr:TetR/AcrR family transcriptional regulator [Novosphingobium lentum]
MAEPAAIRATSSPVAARRSQVERSEAMRARVASAAFELVAKGGMKALTVRGVAATADVSQGAVLHHFPDKNALVLCAIEQALDLARVDSVAWLAHPVDGREAVLRAMLAEFRGFFFSERFWVAMGITLESARDRTLFPAVRRKVNALRTPIYEAWANRLETNGFAPLEARRDVRAAAALVSGAAIRRFWADSDDVTAEIEEQWIAGRLARPV